MTASPKAMTQQHIGLSTVTIEYSRPNIISQSGENRSGKIWGSLVPYELSKPIPGFGSGNSFPWRAGANENTTIEFSHDAKIEGREIAAGKYGFHIIPHDDSTATLIFSTNSSSWGSYFYDSEEDALRVNIQCQPTDFTQRLTYEFVAIADESCLVALDWEFMRFAFEIEFDVHEIVFENMSNELRGLQGFGWEAPYEAAQYCIDNGIHLEQAEVWLNRSLQGEENFSNLFAKSQLLELRGRHDEALEIREKALNLPSVTSNNWYSAGRDLLEKYAEAAREEQKERYAQDALRIFSSAIKKYKDDMLITYGLGRAYSANGQFDKAIIYVKKAKEMTTNDGTKSFFDGQINKLEEGKDIN